MAKKALRDNLLSKAPQFRKDTVEFNGQEYEVRELSLGERNKLSNKIMDKDGNVDYTAAQIWSVIYSVYDPETGEKIFEDADYEQLLKQPSTGSFVDVFTEASSNLSFPDEGKGEGSSEPTNNSK